MTTKVFVVVLLVARRLVKVPSVAKKLDDDALVRIDDDAKTFWVKILRKRSALVPKVYALVVSGMMSLNDEVAPAETKA